MRPRFEAGSSKEEIVSAPEKWSIDEEDEAVV
jgi:hypothetical protein